MPEIARMAAVARDSIARQPPALAELHAKTFAAAMAAIEKR